MFAPHDVHAHEHGCPVARFGSTCTSSNLQNGIELILFGTKQVFELQVFYSAQGHIGLCVGLFLVGITRMKKLVHHSGVFDNSTHLVKLLCPDFQVFDVLEDFFSLLGVVPEVGL